jgi:hypothetical protein
LDDIEALRRIVDDHARHLIGDAEFRARVDARIDALEGDLEGRKAAALRWRAAFASSLVGLLVAVFSFALGRL